MLAKRWGLQQKAPPPHLLFLQALASRTSYVVSLDWLSFRPSSHGKAILPFHLRSSIWNGQIGCSHGNGTIVYQFCFVFSRERNRSIDMFSFCLFRRERNGTEQLRTVSLFVSLVQSFHFLERNLFYLKCSRLNATLQRSTFRNNTERSGTIAFPCDRDLCRIPNCFS